MKSLLKFLFSLVFIFFNSCFAQDFDLEWVVTQGGMYNDVVLENVVDGVGNSYALGYFRETMDFDPGEGEYNLSSNGYKDIFIQKLNPEGELVWVKAIGGGEDDIGTHIIIDAFDNIYITGEFNDKVDFDPGEGIANLYSYDDSDVFILKLDKNGNFIWAKSNKGKRQNSAFSIVSDSYGNVYTVGSFRGKVDFDPGMEKFYLESPSNQVFIQKLSPEGEFVWVKSFEGGWSNSGKSIVIDSEDNLFVCGEYEYTTNFGLGGDKIEITSNGRDIFLLRMNMEGDLIWVKSFGGEDYDFSQDLSLDSDGNVYLVGSFTSEILLDPDQELISLNGTEWTNSVFMAKFNNNGDYIWGRHFEGLTRECNCSLVVDKMENIYLNGTFRDTVEFGTDESVINLISNGGFDVFLQKLDKSGHFIWAKSFGGEYSDFNSSITFDVFDNLYLTGGFSDTVHLSPNETTLASVTNGYVDCYIQKLNSNYDPNQKDLLNEVIIFPNPTADWVNIYLDDLPNVTLNLYNVHGQLIYNKDNINQSIYSFDLNMSSGVYFIELSTQKETRRYKLITK